MSAFAFVACCLAPAACDAPQVSEMVPEPSQALRRSEERGEVPEDARVADYVLDARLDESAHRVEGTARIVWRNTSASPVDRLPFHLYMNGFRAEDTSWMRGTRGSHRGHELETGGWGYIDIKSVERIHGQPLNALVLDVGERPSTALDWAEDEDPSTMTVTLDQPVEAGAAVEVEIAFVTQLPRVFARTGYHDDFHMVGQWFPKIAVLDADGWKNHTFTANSEFYADFGHYLVRLDVPDSMVVGATGIRVDEDIADGRKRLTYRAEMVHDFAWAADPRFVEHYGEHQGIRIRQLIQPEHVSDAPAHLEAQVQALESMEARFGPYPWSTITIVHARDEARGAGGMEYPTFYTTSNIPHPPVPRWVFEERAMGRFTTIHEFGHQYFQGMFASNEFAQPWLDEGMNEMSNHLVYDDAHGEDAWLIRFFGREMSTRDIVRTMLRGRGGLDPVDASADQFARETGSYGAMVYRKTAATMLTLREIVGKPAFDGAMSRYATAARFRHPTGSQLEDILVHEIGGPDGVIELHPSSGKGDTASSADVVRFDVRDYLDQALRETTEVDFAVRKVDNRRRQGHAGYHRSGDTLELTDPDETEGASVEELPDERVEGLVVVHRIGGMSVPVEIEVEFADGERETVYWDGRARHRTFTWPGRRVVYASADPHRRLWLESHRHDNVRYARRAKKTDDRRRERTLARWSEATALITLGVLGP